jgi:hypothetical protein
VNVGIVETCAFSMMCECTGRRRDAAELFCDMSRFGYDAPRYVLCGKWPRLVEAGRGRAHWTPDPVKINKPSGRQDGSDTHMDYDLVYSFVIGVTGAILFLFVDRLEPNRAVSSLLKFLVLFVSSIIIMQKLRSNGLSLF